MVPVAIWMQRAAARGVPENSRPTLGGPEQLERRASACSHTLKGFPSSSGSNTI
jgi:hypothetical protein